MIDMSTVTPLPVRPQPRSLGEVVSRIVRLLMAEHEVTQTALAAVLGITQTQVSARLHGRTQWSLDDLTTLAVYFGVPVTQLVGGGRGTGPQGDGGERARRDSNPQPSDPKVVPLRAKPKVATHDRKVA